MIKTKLFGIFSDKPNIPEVPLKPVNKLFYFKACNGAGKSTIPSEMAKRDPRAYYLIDGKRKIATVFPSYEIVAIGKYDSSNSKGCDALKDTAEIMAAIEYVSEQYEYAGWSIIVDGIIPATILETWVERLSIIDRELIITFINTPLETCLERISARNGGKVLEDKLVKLVTDKFRRINNHKEQYKTLFTEIPSVTIDATSGIDEMLNKFLKEEYL